MTPPIRAAPGEWTYLDFSVPDYWVVDPENGVVWMWSAETGPDEPRRVEGTVGWAFPEGSEELEIDVAEVVAAF